MLAVRAAAYLVEAANPRHEHEWAIWQDLKLPDDSGFFEGGSNDAQAMGEWRSIW
jgi:5-methyltetrahydropteroyltriglutamate--homocysteine methyltransferase